MIEIAGGSLFKLAAMNFPKSSLSLKNSQVLVSWTFLNSLIASVKTCNRLASSREHILLVEGFVGVLGDLKGLFKLLVMLMQNTMMLYCASVINA